MQTCIDMHTYNTCLDRCKDHHINLHRYTYIYRYIENNENPTIGTVVVVVVVVVVVKRSNFSNARWMAYNCCFPS